MGNSLPDHGQTKRLMHRSSIKEGFFFNDFFSDESPLRCISGKEICACVGTEKDPPRGTIWPIRESFLQVETRSQLGTVALVEEVINIF